MGLGIEPGPLAVLSTTKCSQPLSPIPAPLRCLLITMIFRTLRNLITGGLYVVQVNLSCLCAGITGMHHHTNLSPNFILSLASNVLGLIV